MDTYSLIYISTVVAAPFGEYGMVELLDRSRRRNALLHVTGMLLKLDNFFLQMLEGSEAAVHELFGRIAIDQRHEIVEIVAESTAPHRLFPDWPMGFRDLNRVDLNRRGVEGTSLTGNELVANPRLCGQLFREAQAIMRFAPLPPDLTLERI